LRDAAAKLGRQGDISVLLDVFGFSRPRVPPDPEPEPTEVSVRDQLDRLEGFHFHLNVIRVGSDNFTDDDDDEIDYALLKARRIYATQHVGIGRVMHFAVPVDLAQGYDNVTSDDEVAGLSDAWTGENDGIDLLMPDVLNVALGEGQLYGRSPVPGPCAFEDDKDMDGAVTGVWGADQTARTMAHELGHYLGLNHQNSVPGNLMCQSGFASDIRTSVRLELQQGQRVWTHCMVHAGLDLERRADVDTAVASAVSLVAVDAG
jgi:hypothetical protein